MRFPAYGRALYERRMAGERPRVVALLVGSRWQRPSWLPAEIPHLAVKPARWQVASRKREDVRWDVVRGMTVLAIDLREEEAIEVEGPGGWDVWLWLLAAVQRHARDVLLFTPRIEFTDPPAALACERDLGIYAFVCSTLDASGKRCWPPWWPFGDDRHERAA
jgi:hypothetical protein